MSQYRQNPKIVESSDFADLHSMHVAPGDDGETYATVKFRLHKHKPYAHSPTPENPAGHPDHGVPTHLHLYHPHPSLMEAKHALDVYTREKTAVETTPRTPEDEE